MTGGYSLHRTGRALVLRREQDGQRRIVAYVARPGRRTLLPNAFYSVTGKVESFQIHGRVVKHDSMDAL